MSELDEKKSLDGKQNKGLEALKDLKSEVKKETEVTN